MLCYGKTQSFIDWVSGRGVARSSPNVVRCCLVFSLSVMCLNARLGVSIECECLHPITKDSRGVGSSEGDMLWERMTKGRISRRSHWATCAIIGGSPRLQRSNYGRIIDKSDIVVRFNEESLRRNGQDPAAFGERTDIFWINGLQSIVQEAKNLSWTLSSNQYIVVADVGKALRKRKFSREGLNHPRILLIKMDNIDVFWTRLLGFKPSSGLRALTLFFRRCTEIRLFGFAFCREDDTTNVATGKEYDAKSHNFTLEVETRQLLSLCSDAPIVSTFV